MTEQNSFLKSNFLVMAFMVFMGVIFIVEPSYAAGLETQANSFWDKIIAFLTAIRGGAITVAVLIGGFILLFARQYANWLWAVVGAIAVFILAPYAKDWL